MNKLLTVNEPFIIHTPEISSLFAILSKNPESFKWLLTKFISMGINKTNTIEELVWYEDYYKSCPFIECNDVLRQDIKFDSFTDFIIKSINDNWYLSLPINNKYIHNYNKEINYPHYLTIYGYDNASHHVYIMDHFRNGKFSFEKCTYNEINNGFYEINKVDNIFNYNLNIRMIRCIEGVRFNIEDNSIIRILQDFIDGSNLVEQYYEKNDNKLNLFDYKDICFGSKYYDALATLIVNPEKNIYLLRQLFLLTAHAKLFLGLAEQIYQSHKIDQISNCKILLKKNRDILNLFLKDSLKYKQKQDTTMNKLCLEILKSKEFECNIMIELIKGIGKYTQ